MEAKTLEDVKSLKLFGNSDFSNIISKSLDVLETKKDEFKGRNMDIGDTPISPIALDDDYTPIILSECVTKEYKKLVELINTPETAKEYSFVLLGKSAKIDEDECYYVELMINCDADKPLSNRETNISKDKLNQAINYGRQNTYNFISIAHTHPNIQDCERHKTVAAYLDNETIKKEYIRDAGLNLSLQDFLSYEDLFRYFFYQPNIKTASTVIMYNGEMVIFSKTNTELKRHVIVLSAIGEPIYTSSKEEYNKFAK